MYIFIYLYIHIHIYIYTHTHIYIHIHTYIYIYIYTNFNTVVERTAMQCDVGKRCGGRIPRPLPKPKLKRSGASSNDTENKSELDRLIEQNMLLGNQQPAHTAEVALTISDLVWNGTLEDFLQPMPDMTPCSSSRPAISNSTETIAATGDEQGCGNKQHMLDRKPVPSSHSTSTYHQNLCASSGVSPKADIFQPQPPMEQLQKRMNWNKWEPDSANAEEVNARRLKDLKNFREMKRKKRRGLHV